MMLDSSRDVLFVSAKRTAFGAFGGAFRDVRATDRGTFAAQAALAQAGFPVEEVDEIIFGNVAQTTPEDVYCARHVGLRAGLPQDKPALTVNRLCGSGFQAIVSAAQEIKSGDADVVLCGGTESMSQAPHVVRGARWGYPFGKAPALEDLLWTTLTDTYAGCAMGMTAEALAERHGIDRTACDVHALLSQKRWAAADEAGRFRDEITPVEVRGKKGGVMARVERDEHPRPHTTLETLGKLAPSFKPDGVVTAGNASGIADGAAALVVASRAAVTRARKTPLGRLVSWGYVGVDPKLMGIGPVPAIGKALQRAPAPGRYGSDRGERGLRAAVSRRRERGWAAARQDQRRRWRHRARASAGRLGGAHRRAPPLRASAQKVTVWDRGGLRRRRPRYCSDSGIVVIGIRVKTSAAACRTLSHLTSLTEEEIRGVIPTVRAQ